MARFFGFRLTTWWHAFAAVWRMMDEKNLGLIAAGVAFFGMLAIFPGIAAVIAIFGLLADPAIVETQLDLMRNIIPSDAFRLLDAQVASLVNAPTESLGIATLLSILAALWLSRAGVAAMMLGLNAINRQPNRTGLRHYTTALVLTMSLVVLAIVALMTIVIAPIVLAFLQLGTITAALVELVRWLVAIMVLLCGLSMLYRFGPNRKGARMAWITPGAFITLLTWAGASAAFSIYLTNFGRYNEIYGSIGAVVALLMWFYISAFLILLGAALNVALEDVRRDRRLQEQPAEAAADPAMDDDDASVA